MRPNPKSRPNLLKSATAAVGLKSGAASGQWRKEVERILITEEQIEKRIKSLAREIEHDFRGREMVVISLLNGTVMFLADLMRHLNL
ncbi:MAG TPA: hypothetical protein VGV18_08265, partial [Verrucomicrobiae bacterium]|nr:hypothetical protein [Verrucomicrobiae bacterium]